MIDWLERTELLVGKETIEKLKNAHVLIVGLGGVGSFAAEFIARAGVGKMTIVDGDVFDITNKNRQLPALDSTIDKSKAEVVAQRLLDINKDLDLNVLNEFISPERAWELMDLKPDYVMDCIDSITPKIQLLKSAKKNKIKIISSMGAGGKLKADKVMVKDISKTKNCKMAKNIKNRLKREGITPKGIRAVFSEEHQDPKSLKMTDGSNYKKSFYGTMSYMPALFGLHAAATVIEKLSKA